MEGKVDDKRYKESFGPYICLLHKYMYIILLYYYLYCLYSMFLIQREKRERGRDSLLDKTRKDIEMH